MRVAAAQRFATTSAQLFDDTEGGGRRATEERELPFLAADVHGDSDVGLDGQLYTLVS